MSGAAPPDRRIRLLFVAGNFVTGGAERHLLEMWRRLDRTRFDVRIAVLKKEGAFTPPVEALGLPLHDLGVGRRLYDLSGLRDLFQSFFASIPRDWYRNSPIAQYEGYYASIFYSYFAALGLDIRLEDTTNHGRIDMTVLFNAQVYLFEFKVVELIPGGKALQQLQDKGYADKYRARGEPIHLIGVEFSKESRSVVGFEVALIGV